MRLVRYLHDRGLWLDEVYLALNLVNRSFSGLASELDDLQYAPYGFLVVMKLCVLAFGTSEWAFRAFPFFASLILTGLFYVLARRVLRASAVPLALLLYALSFPLLVYSTEAKVYGVDASIAIGLVLLATSYRSRTPAPVRGALVFALAGASAVWFSFPAAFVLAGIGLSLAMEDLVRRDWRGLGLLSAVSAAWLVSFGAQAWLMVGSSDPQMPAADLGGLRSYYSEDFLPWPPAPAAVVEWLMHFFATLTGFFTSDVAAGVAMTAFTRISPRMSVADFLLPPQMAKALGYEHIYVAPKRGDWGATYSIDALLRQRAGDQPIDPRDTSPRYVMPIHALLIVLAALFFDAGVLKVVNYGAGFGQDHFMGHLFLMRRVDTAVHGISLVPFANAMYQHPLIDLAARWLVIGFELSFIAALVSYRLRAFYVSSALIFGSNTASAPISTMT